MSQYFKNWRVEHMKIFNTFLQKYYPNYYDKFYYIGGTRFNLDRKKFSNFYEKNIENPLIKLNINTVDIDCHFYLNDIGEKDFQNKVEIFQKGFKYFIDSSVDEYIDDLLNLTINEKNSIWKVSKNVKNNILYKYEYLVNNKFTEYYPSMPTQGDIHPVYSSMNDNYYILNEDKTVNYNASRPYMLFRESIVLKNKKCNYIKAANLLELNIISKTRLFNMYNYFNNYNSYNLLDRINVPFNIIVVFLQKLCYDNEKDEMKNMLYSTWINYKFNIKPKNNLYRFVHYAKYYSEKDLYTEYINDFNDKLKNYLKLNNRLIYSVIKIPEEKEINNLINICNNYNETILLSESEPEIFKCKSNDINIDTMDFEYGLEEDKNYEEEKKEDKDEVEENEKYMDIYDEDDIIENIKKIKI